MRSPAVASVSGSLRARRGQQPRCCLAPGWGWRRAQRWFDATAAWCYIGKDVRIREEIERSAPRGRRFHLRDKLHAVAEQMRHPYIQLVARLGKMQADRAGWWASSFASKSPFQTDFFLLVCYKVLVLQLVEEWNDRDGALLVYLEDPWLYADLATALAGRTDVAVFGPRVVIWPTVLAWRARGIVSRILCAGYLAVAWLTAGVVRRRRDVRARKTDQAVGIVSIPEGRSIQEDTFHDPYLGPLDGLLESQGIDVVRVIFPFSPLSLVARAARLRGAWPLILELRPQDLFTVVKSWKPTIPDDVRMGEYPVALLLRRESLSEFRTSVFIRNLIVRNLVRRFLSRRYVSTLVYFFENQPWEKMACLAAAEAGVRVVAHQHSTVPRFLMMYFLGEGEHAYTPLPARILTNGPYATHLLLSEGGYPPSRIVEAGSWRYEYLHRPPAMPSRRSRTVIVALPADASLARLLWTKAAEAAEGLRARSWRLVVKPHPDVPAARLGMGSSARRAVEISEAPFAELLDGADIVVGSGTTVLEASLRGKKVIRVRYENRLDLDPAAADGAGVRVADEDELGEQILRYAETGASFSDHTPPHAQDAFFSPSRPEVWLREIRGGR